MEADEVKTLKFWCRREPHPNNRFQNNPSRQHHYFRHHQYCCKFGIVIYNSKLFAKFERRRSKNMVVGKYVLQ